MIHLATLLVYVTAFLLWLRTLIRGSSDVSGVAPGAVAAAGVGLHLLALALYVRQWEALPLVGLGPSLSTLSLLIGLGLVASLRLTEAVRVGILILPFMILLVGVALLAGLEPAPADLDFQGAWFALHVTLGLAGVGGMAVAGASGTLYLLQFRELKSKRLGRLFQFLPPLATLDALGRVGAVAGFVAMSLAIALGLAWTLSFSTLSVTDPEVQWALFAWAVILGVLIVRSGGGRVEHRSAVAGLVGFGLIVASYLVVRMTAGAGDLFL